MSWYYYMVVMSLVDVDADMLTVIHLCEVIQDIQQNGDIEDTSY